jgi:transposase
MYLFGAFSPITGDDFRLYLPYCNSETFQLFLDLFSLERSNELKVVFLDNGAFHKAKKLIIPDNVILIFLPPYSPELNPAEKVWWVLKREINLCVFKTIEDLMDKLEVISKNFIVKDKIKILTSYQVFLSAYQTIIYV